MSKNNIIHINGRRYDATSGEPLDGVLRHKPAKPAAHKSHAAKPASPATHRHDRHHTVNHTHSHPAHSSRTLMRHAVRKPGRQHRIKAQGHTDALQRSLPVIPVKPSVLSFDESRIRQALHVRRSGLISHFSGAAIYPAAEPARPEPTPVKRHVTTPHRRSHKPSIRRHKPRSTAEVLEHALKHASSYRELPVK